jgi:hypothetical protein
MDSLIDIWIDNYGGLKFKEDRLEDGHTRLTVTHTEHTDTWTYRQRDRSIPRQTNGYIDMYTDDQLWVHRLTD